MAKSNMLFQVLQELDWIKFDEAVLKHQGDKSSKGFSCRGQLTSMLYCQLANARSLSEISNGLSGESSLLSQYGIKKAPPKQTLSYANKTRAWEIYSDFYQYMLNRARNELKSMGLRTKLRIKTPLKSLDATLIPVCLEAFDWALYRQTKGALKINLVLDHEGYLPEFAFMTDGKTHELEYARDLELAPGTVVLMDRAYCDYGLLKTWDEKGLYFVSKLKSNAAYDVVEERDIPKTYQDDIFDDQVIQLSKNGLKLRRVVALDTKGETAVLLTNNMDWAASTIVALYRERWAIEIFFRDLKCHFRVKTFVGTSVNAVMIQIWTALLAILLLKYLKLKSRTGWSLSNLIALIRVNLFNTCDLMEWLSGGSPGNGDPPESGQLTQPDLFLDSVKA